MRQLLLDPELLANAVEWSWKNSPKIWEDLAERCLGCGICTYVCPLCHCFSIEDRVGLDDKCSRCRKWDACTLPGFAKIAGGHSFRPTIKERYYNWFYHKFVRAYKEYGKSQCVGCGRCKKYCPAQIDIQEVLKTILEDYKKQNG
jgi:ferredoxin